jgi:hypothetical protein
MSDVSDEDQADQAVHLSAMLDIVDDFWDHDALALRTLTPAGRAEQYAVRNALHQYCTDIWENAKLVGERPADDPRFGAVAALIQLADSLRSAAAEAQSDAHDTLE